MIKMSPLTKLPKNGDSAAHDDEDSPHHDQVPLGVVSHDRGWVLLNIESPLDFFFSLLPLVLVQDLVVWGEESVVDIVGQDGSQGINGTGQVTHNSGQEAGNHQTLETCYIVRIGLR